MTDAEKLAALAKVHEKWGDTHDEDLDHQALWEDIGFILGTIEAAIV